MYEEFPQLDDLLEYITENSKSMKALIEKMNREMHELAYGNQRSGIHRYEYYLNTYEQFWRKIFKTNPSGKYILTKILKPDEDRYIGVVLKILLESGNKYLLKELLVNKYLNNKENEENILDQRLNLFKSLSNNFKLDNNITKYITILLFRSLPSSIYSIKDINDSIVNIMLGAARIYHKFAPFIVYEFISRIEDVTHIFKITVSYFRQYMGLYNGDMNYNNIEPIVDLLYSKIIDAPSLINILVSEEKDILSTLVYIINLFYPYINKDFVHIIIKYIDFKEFKHIQYIKDIEFFKLIVYRSDSEICRELVSSILGDKNEVKSGLIVNRLDCIFSVHNKHCSLLQKEHLTSKEFSNVLYKYIDLAKRLGVIFIKKYPYEYDIIKSFIECEYIDNDELNSVSNLLLQNAAARGNAKIVDLLINNKRLNFTSQIIEKYNLILSETRLR